MTVTSTTSRKTRSSSKEEEDAATAAAPPPASTTTTTTTTMTHQHHNKGGRKRSASLGSVKETGESKEDSNKANNKNKKRNRSRSLSVGSSSSKEMKMEEKGETEAGQKKTTPPSQQTSTTKAASRDATATTTTATAPSAVNSRGRRKRASSLDSSSSNNANKKEAGEVGQQRRKRSASLGSSVEEAAAVTSNKKNKRRRARSLSGGSSKEIKKTSSTHDESSKDVVSNNKSKTTTTTGQNKSPRKESLKNKHGDKSTTATTAAASKTGGSQKQQQQHDKSSSKDPKHDSSQDENKKSPTATPKHNQGKSDDKTTQGGDKKRQSPQKQQQQQHDKSSKKPRHNTNSKRNKSPTTTAQGGGDKQKTPHKQQHHKSSTKQNDDKPKEDKNSKIEKRPPTMDVIVHRMRHFDYQPAPIVCMRASPPAPPPSSLSSSSNNNNANLLAVSRENGSVELRAMDEKTRIIATIAGYQQQDDAEQQRRRHVSTMTWLCGGTGDDIGGGERPTLIGASQDGSIFIVDFCQSKFKGMISSDGGGVFSLTSLCERNTCSCQNGGSGRRRCFGLVAAGCQDGTVRILQCKNNNSLEIVASLPSASAAVLSVAWQRETTNSNSDDVATQNDMAGSVLFAGIADGTIRRYDCEACDNDGSNSGCRWKASLRMTVESHGRAVPTRTWALETLKDGTVISGDSLGHVQFWDGHTGSLLQSLDQTETKADVLDIAVTADECKVFCSGVDSRVVCIERKQQQANAMDVDDDYRPWILSNAQRPHTHDVKAVTICRQAVRGSKRKQQGVIEILCTGGVDTKLCTYQVSDFQRQRPRIIYPWPSVSPVSTATEARLVSFRRDDCVEVHRLEASKPRSQMQEPIIVPEDQTLVGTVKIKGPSNLVCSSLSKNGKYLAVSDGTLLYLFEIAMDKNSQLVASRLSVDELPTPLSVVSVKFISNERLLLAAVDGRIIILEFRQQQHPSSSADDEMEVDGAGTGSTRQKHVDVSVKQIIEADKDEQTSTSCLPIHSISILKGNRFATFRNEIGGNGQVAIYSSTGKSDGLYHREWVLPKLDAPISSVTFLKNKTPQIAVGCVNFALYVFDIQQRRLTKWSETAGFPLSGSGSLPQDFSNRRDYPVRLSTDTASPSKVLMCSFGAFVVVDMAIDFPTGCRSFPESHVRHKKRKRSESESLKDNDALQKKREAVVCLRYNSMLHLDFVADREMIVVEQPWLNVVANFPEALQRRIYGA